MPRSVSLLVAALAGLSATFAAAEEAQWRSLLDKSPFMAEAGDRGLPDSAPFEFRGLVMESGSVWVNLYDPESGRSQWNLVPSSPAPGLRLESYDAGAERLAVVFDGRRIELAMQQGRVQLPLDLRPLVVPVSVSAAPAGETREAFIRRLPRDARELLQQAQRRRHELVPSTMLPPDQS